jgi:ubiquinone/menaquinone biosynthesis C-methylase UbiE
MKKHKHGFKLNGTIQRAAIEYRYITHNGWSLEDVGHFWDSVIDYDEINESTYSYYRRFTNSYQLAKEFLSKSNTMLDIQARSGKGTEFWFKKGLVDKSYLIDFSDHLLSIAQKRLSNTKYNYELIKVIDYHFPFNNEFFDFIINYETIEHISDVDRFLQEITRVLKNDGILIITCPNILWEPVHWFSAIFDLHHSEGPHRFLRRKKLLDLFRKNHLTILKENTTVILPFNNKKLIYVNEILEKILHYKISRLIGLRRTFILKKIVNSNL